MEKNYRAELVGVLGDPVDGNPTGVMEEAGFAHAGLNYRYITVRVLPEDLDAAMAGVRAFHMRGVNLTMPHKINVLKYMDELSEAARVIGAVNTVVCRPDGTMFGENTDGKGFVQSLLDERVPLAGRVICLLGAGGAARSIAVECALAGAARIYVINRNEARGRSLAKTVAEHTAAQAVYLPWQGTARVPEDTQILINATCVGLSPQADACPDIEFADVRPDMTVCDVVFNPVDTVFLTRARARGAKTIDGLGMLTNQGCINFTLWTGEKAPRDVMYARLRAEFERR
ncbi:MAG: shikimate dehydrogenase [Clostridia bacterium]|nr:shikimate dehydrogenase [Clostridia bacterium]